MRERLQIGNSMINEGNYDLTVVGVPEKLNDKANSRKWKFGVFLKGEIVKEIFIFLPPWEAKELILAVGGKEDGDYVDWDDELVDGKCVNCDIKHVEYTNKNGEIKKKYSLSNITETIPF